MLPALGFGLSGSPARRNLESGDQEFGYIGVMKSIRQANHASLIVFIVSAWLMALPAQAQTLAGRGGATASANIVQTGARTLDLATLSPITQEALPARGSFYFASGGPPLPFPPGRFGPSRYGADALAAAPAYVIDAQRHVYVIDDRAVLAMQMLAQSADDSIPIPGGGGEGGDGGSGGGTNSYAPTYSFDTNLL
jgi:hypothetical protein